MARTTGSAGRLHWCLLWHILDTREVITRDLQDLSLYLGDSMWQYTRLEGLLVSTEDTIAIFNGGGQEIARDSPSQDILVLRDDGRHLKLAFRVFLKY